MALKTNIYRHLLAGLTGEGYSDELARDFWPPSEDLWDSSAQVHWRWLKLVFVFCASAFTQIMIPVGLVFVILSPFIDPHKRTSATYWTAVLTGAGAFALAVIIATHAYVSIIRERNKSY